MQAMEKSLDEADVMMDHMSLHHAEWKSMRKQACTALQTTIPDALLTAGYVIYCGPLGQSVRDGMLSDWLTRCETSNFVFETAVSGSDLLPESSERHLLVPNENYSVAEVIGLADLLPELETSGMLSDSCSQHNTALIYSCLFFHSPLQRWTLLIDPDDQAEACIRYILERVPTTSRAFTNSESICMFTYYCPMYKLYYTICLLSPHRKLCNPGTLTLLDVLVGQWEGPTAR